MGDAADLSQNGGVSRLHHRVNDGLWVDDDVYVVVAGTKEVVGFDDFQSLAR